MRSFFNSLLAYFLTPGGLVLMGILDSSIIFFLPLGIDVVVIVLAARNAERFWLYALLATLGSVAGAIGTFWLGRKVGEHGLARLIRPSRLERVRSRVSGHAAAGVALLAAIPPPFPFTAFVLASGASGLNPWIFGATLAAVRAVRFTTEAALAAKYGRGILSWMESTTFEVAVGALTVVAIGGTIVSGLAVFRTAKRSDVQGGAGDRGVRR